MPRAAAGLNGLICDLDSFERRPEVECGKKFPRAHRTLRVADAFLPMHSWSSLCLPGPQRKKSPIKGSSVPTTRSVRRQGEEFQSIMLEMLRQNQSTGAATPTKSGYAAEPADGCGNASPHLEEERRTKAEEKVVEAAEAGRKAAEIALTQLTRRKLLPPRPLPVCLSRQAMEVPEQRSICLLFL